MTYEFINFQTYTNPYMRIVRVSDKKQWDDVLSVLDVAATWADTVITLTADSNVGGYPVSLPALLPAGEYDILFYDALSPADSDVVDLGKRVQWTGKSRLGQTYKV